MFEKLIINNLQAFNFGKVELYEKNKSKREIVEKKLTDYANEYISQTFKKPYQINVQVKLDNRTKNILGRAFLSDPNHLIKISSKMVYLKKIFESNGLHCDDLLNNVMDTIKHEIVHLILFHNGFPFNDGDSFFEDMLHVLSIKPSGSTSKIKRWSLHDVPSSVYYYKLKCNHCGYETYARSISKRYCPKCNKGLDRQKGILENTKELIIQPIKYNSIGCKSKLTNNVDDLVENFDAGKNIKLDY